MAKIKETLERTGIFGYFVRHGTIANLILVLMVMAGAAAIPQMRSQYFPDTVTDSIRVSVVWTGAGAEDVDSAIVQLIEPALLAVEGVSTSEATSREGGASISLEFEPDWDMAQAKDDVTQALDAISDLPDSAEDPVVTQSAWRDGVTDIVITGPVGVAQLANFADELTIRLFAEGVTRTSIQGLAAPQTIVEVPSTQLIANDVSMQEIANAIQAEVQADPAGDVGASGSRVRTGVEKRSAQDIAAIALKSETDGSKITIGDIASVTVEGVDRNRAYYVGDNPAITVVVQRSSQGDAIGIQNSVEEVLAEFRTFLPEGVQADMIRTRSEQITGRLDILISNASQGLILVLVVLFLFLNARTAIWVAAGIPASLLAAIALMYVGGLTINMISLFALIITLGIVVDDAIVVGEHADHLARTGQSPYQAAENAAKRMSLPVFSATLTTVIAFFGLTSIGGRFGSIVGDIPFTVIAVLLASLVECFLILPNHMAHAISKQQGKTPWYDWPSRVCNHGFDWFRDTLFRPFVGYVVRARYVVLAGAVVLLASQIALFITGDVQWRFFNAPERASISGNFAMAPSADRDDTLEQMRLLQESVESLGAEYEERYGLNPITYVVTQVGGTAGRGLAGTDSKEDFQLGAVAIELIEADFRPEYSSFDFVADLQRQAQKHPLLETLSFRRQRNGPGGDALDIQLSGASSETLKAASEDLKTALAQFGEVSAVEDNLSYDKEELILELTPQGAALGFDIDTLGSVLGDRLGGIEAATYPDGPRSAAIRVELPEDELTADFLERMFMRTPNGDYLPLADLVQVDQRTGFSTVRRENGVRLISVTGDVSEDDPARANEIMEIVETEILPEIANRRQVAFSMSGLSEQEGDFLNDAMTGLVLILGGIYLVLCWVFASWTRPLVVMSIIPFGLIGTIYGHWVWGVPLSIFSVIGLLGMIGIIINDSIVLVTQIDEFAEDRGLVPSIIDGAADRLRAVFLTTATTVLGLAPLLYERSTQAEFLKPTVITLVYGLGAGFFLVLIVVPALMAAQHDIARFVAAAKRGLRFPRTGIQLTYNVAAVLILAWLGATMLHVAFTGALPAMLTGLMPGGAMLSAFLLFLLGSATVLLGIFALASFGALGAVGRKRA